MTNRKTHWLDEIAQGLWEELHLMADDASQALRGDVPLGTVSQSPEEQVATFVSMSPEQHMALRQQIGDEEYADYASNMMDSLAEQVGPLAPYVMGDIQQVVDQVLEAPLQMPQGVQGGQEEIQ